jgi:hypothetical protein
MHRSCEQNCGLQNALSLGGADSLKRLQKAGQSKQVLKLEGAIRQELGEGCGAGNVTRQPSGQELSVQST